MTQPQYRYAHQQTRKRLAPVVAAGDAYCAELVCKMRTRWIAPGSDWDLAHDRVNGGYLGPAHSRCNRSEGAAFGNRKRGGRRKPLPRPSTSGRWAL
jgi:hypothetical protein